MIARTAAAHVVTLAVTLAVVAPAAAQTAATAPAPTSQTDRMTSCNADARTQGLKGAERRTFMSGCLKGRASAAPAAAPAPSASASSPTAAPAAPPEPEARRPSPAQLAERDRIRRCGAAWKADKATGKVAAGQTWPKYWSACNARLKGGG